MGIYTSRRQSLAVSNLQSCGSGFIREGPQSGPKSIQHPVPAWPGSHIHASGQAKEMPDIDSHLVRDGFGAALRPFADKSAPTVRDLTPWIAYEM